MTVTVRAPLVHLCPYVDEIDVGSVELTFTDETPELHGLRQHLESYATVKATHEEVVAQLAKELPTAAIVGFFTTAGMEVEVRP